jgi:hypothetical protein
VAGEPEPLQHLEGVLFQMNSLGGITNTDGQLRPSRRDRDVEEADLATTGRQGPGDQDRDATKPCGWALQDSNLGKDKKKR